MAFHKTLARRFLHVAKACSSNLRPSIARKPLACRFLHKDPIPPDRFPLPLPAGESLAERIRALNGPRIRLDCLFPPRIQEAEESAAGGMSIEEARKVMKEAQVDMARSKLRSMEKECVSYSEFLAVCSEISGLYRGLGIAKALDESGAVIVLGNVVFLRPDQERKEGLRV